MITSLQNKRVAAAGRLKKRAMRELDGLFLVEGAQAVGEALRTPGVVREVFHAPDLEERLDEILQVAKASSVPIRVVSTDVVSRITSTVTPQGLVAVASFVDADLAHLDEPRLVPVLVEVRDPGNAGTIVRSADAAGADAVVFTSSSVDVYNPKTVRSTAGSLFHVPVVRGVAVGEAVTALRERGLQVLAADADGDRSVYETDLTRPTAVLFGNEAHGLSGDVAALADATVRVPIEGRAESLNLAAAATVVLFEAARQRGGTATGGDELAQIVAGAAHDIRSPLTAVKGFASTLLSRWDRLDDEQRVAMIEAIQHDGSRMEAVIAQLVDAARLRSGRLELAPVPTDLFEAATRVAEELSRFGVAEVVVEGAAAKAVVDPARLRTILVAFVEGASWWGESGPVRIDVTPGPPPSVAVSKEGTSLRQEDVPALFRPRQPGTGGGSKVGLYVSKGLIEAHGGSLEVSTEGGVSFVARFPMRRA